MDVKWGLIAIALCKVQDINLFLIWPLLYQFSENTYRFRYHSRRYLSTRIAVPHCHQHAYVIRVRPMTPLPHLGLYSFDGTPNDSLEDWSLDVDKRRISSAVKYNCANFTTRHVSLSRRSRSFWVTDFDVIQKFICDFLLLDTSNFHPIWHRFFRTLTMNLHDLDLGTSPCDTMYRQSWRCFVVTCRFLASVYHVLCFT